jgi:hypothetical protein
MFKVEIHKYTLSPLAFMVGWLLFDLIKGYPSSSTSGVCIACLYLTGRMLLQDIITCLKPK